jgi:hypothetical protein
MEDSRNQCHVTAGEYGQTDQIHIFLDRTLDDLLRRYPESQEDHLKGGIPENPRHQSDAPVVAIEAGFGQQYPDVLVIVTHVSPVEQTRSLSIRHTLQASLISPMEA